MGRQWLEALFADLGRRQDPDVAPHGLGEKGELRDRRDERWHGGRRTSSPPKPTFGINDYDIAAHARQSLQIGDSGQQAIPNNRIRTPSYQPGSTRPYEQWQQASSHPSTSSSHYPDTSYVLHSTPVRHGHVLPPPLGPRPALFPQEIPKQGSSHNSSYQPVAGTGGFIDPRSTHSAKTLSRQDPYEHPQTPPRRPHLSSTASRPQFASAPGPPAFLATPPPPVLHRPYSDPQRPSKNSSAPEIDKNLASGKLAAGKSNQCHGTTGAGKRCARIVKPSPKTATSGTQPSVSKNATTTKDLQLGKAVLRQLDRRLSVGKNRPSARRGAPSKKTGRKIIESDSEEEDDFDIAVNRLTVLPEDDGAESDDLEELPVYCYQHAKQILDQRGTFIGPKSVDFQDWIPAHLPQETQLQLRNEMARVSLDQKSGYIYVHEFPFSSETTGRTTMIKLGRSVRPVARLSQWKLQCKSRQPVVRDIFPLHPSHPLYPGHTAHTLVNQYQHSPSHQNGRLLFAEQGAKHHQKWERLCLIELAGIAAVQARDRQDDEGGKYACGDCGRVHVELFLVDKYSYEKEIRDMVLRWQKFVETIL